MNDERTTAEMHGHSDRSLLDIVCNNATVALFIMDERQECIYMNPAAERLTGYALDELRGRALHDVIHHSRPDGTPYPLAECPIDRAFPKNNREQGREVFVHKDGSFYPVAYTASPIRKSGGIVGTVIEVRDISDELAWQRSVEDESRVLEIVNRTGAMLSATLDRETLVQSITDVATEVTGAKFGAFFYTMVTDTESFQLYTLSGAPRAAFEKFPMPRNTKIFAPTFKGEGVVRSDDITQDSRYGKNPPYNGMPKGHLPVRSYLAAPVCGRSGEVIGGLFLGHPQPGIFDDRAERLIRAVAAQASVAMDNASLYEAAQADLAARRRSEAQQQLLIQELNHRVKNMLANVQSIAAQTFNATADPAEALQKYRDRLQALSRSHSLILKEQWGEVDLRALAAAALAPYAGEGPESQQRTALEGPEVRMTPKLSLALGMGFHELATNAARHGALSTPLGGVAVRWTLEPDRMLRITWSEHGGPPVSPPAQRGFGSRLLERGLSHELGGSVELDYRAEGLVATVSAQLPREVVHDG